MSSLTWQEISSISATGKAAECFSIGDTKALTKPSGVNAIFVHNRGAGRMVFCTSKTVFSFRGDDDGTSWETSISGWAFIHPELEKQYQSIFDQEVISTAKNVSINTSHPYQPRPGEMDGVNIQTTQKFYPPSASEVGGNGHVPYEQGEQFSYFTTSANRGSKGEYYTRSCRIDGYDSYYLIGVHNDGMVYADFPGGAKNFLICFEV